MYTFTIYWLWKSFDDFRCIRICFAKKYYIFNQFWFMWWNLSQRTLKRLVTIIIEPLCMCTQVFKQTNNHENVLNIFTFVIVIILKFIILFLHFKIRTSFQFHIYSIYLYIYIFFWDYFVVRKLNFKPE